MGRLIDSVLRPEAGRELGDGVIRTINWSAASLTDGVYFAVLQAGDQKQSRKLVVRR